MDEKTIKALLTVAGSSSDPDAVDGVLQVQELIKERNAFEAELASVKAKAESDATEYKERLDKATRDMAHIIATVGITKREPEKTSTDRAEAYRKHNAGIY